jgi:hypothetical protein
VTGTSPKQSLTRLSVKNGSLKARLWISEPRLGVGRPRPLYRTTSFAVLRLERGGREATTGASSKIKVFSNKYTIFNFSDLDSTLKYFRLERYDDDATLRDPRTRRDAGR